jgi:hypothetical protein
VGVTILAVKNKLAAKCHKGPRNWAEFMDKCPKLRKMDTRFGTWDVRSLYRETEWGGMDWIDLAQDGNK